MGLRSARSPVPVGNLAWTWQVNNVVTILQKPPFKLAKATHCFSSLVSKHAEDLARHYMLRRHGGTGRPGPCGEQAPCRGRATSETHSGGWCPGHRGARWPLAGAHLPEMA